MKGDFSRSTHRPTNRYSSVRLQQGRVLLDAEWNEQADLALQRERASSVDVIGRTGAPKHSPDDFRHFQIALADEGRDLVIAPGHIYVDGLRCENHREGGMRLSQQPDLPGVPCPSTMACSRCTSTCGSGTSRRSISRQADSRPCARSPSVARHRHARAGGVAGPAGRGRGEGMRRVRRTGGADGTAACAGRPRRGRDQRLPRAAGRRVSAAREPVVSRGDPRHGREHRALQVVARQRQHRLARACRRRCREDDPCGGSRPRRCAGIRVGALRGTDR